MLYVLELAPIEQSIARQAAQNGRPLDKRIENAPTLQLGLQLFLQAFFDLDSERSHGMSVTRIPKSAVRQYARDFGFDQEETDELEYYITVMDNAECKRVIAVRERESKNASVTQPVVRNKK